MMLLELIQEGGGLIPSPGEVGVEQAVGNFVLWLRLVVETLGAAIIGVGIIAAGYIFVRSVRKDKPHNYNGVRLTFARLLALALEFQLAADILSTAVAPSWNQIGKLAAIAVIRTALNYFLTREIGDERRELTPQTGLTVRDTDVEQRTTRQNQTSEPQIAGE